MARYSDHFTPLTANLLQCSTCPFPEFQSESIFDLNRDFCSPIDAAIFDLRNSRRAMHCGLTITRFQSTLLFIECSVNNKNGGRKLVFQSCSRVSSHCTTCRKLKPWLTSTTSSCETDLLVVLFGAGVHFLVLKLYVVNFYEKARS